MQPRELTAASFVSYPTKGRAVAVEHLALLQNLPLSLLPLLLREVIAYDVRFPAEQRMLDDQFAYLASLPAEQRENLLHGFVAIEVTETLAAIDWVRQPRAFSEALTAHLWATHQMDAFRTAADAYAEAWRKAKPDREPPIPRLGIVLAGQGCDHSPHPIFRKLRPYGTYFPNVDPAKGLAILTEALEARAAKHREPYHLLC